MRVVLSGPLCSGKTTVASALAKRGATVVSVRQELQFLLGSENAGRDELQAFGEALEASTGGKWILEAVRRVQAGVDQVLVVDAARTLAQRYELGRLPGEQLNLHLTCPSQTRAARFVARIDPAFDDPGASFEAVMAQGVDPQADDLAVGADVVIKTDALSIHHMVNIAVSEIDRWITSRSSNVPDSP